MDTFKQYLQRISPITDAEYAEAMPFFTPRTLAKGEYFIRQGEVARHAAFILSGVLRTWYLNNKAEETTSCFCSENNFSTSYRSFILQEPSELSLQAIEETRLLVIHLQHLHQLYIQHPVWQTIGRVAVEKEYLVLEQYASVLNNDSAKEKYLRLLRDQPAVLQKAKVEDVASYLGVTRRTLSRIRKEVKTI